MNTRLTLRAWAVLAGSAALLVAGQLLGYPLLQVLAGAGIAVVLVSVLTVVRRPKVAVERVLYPDRVECGQPALARLVVRNESTRRQPAFVAADSVGPHQSEVSVAALAPAGVATYHYELPTSRRGPVPVGPLVLRRSDPFGLVTCRVSIGTAATLLVHPRRYAARPATGIRQRHHFEGPVSAGPLRGSIDLRRLREYVPGDEVRHVHWKASARAGRLMVREYVDPDQPRLQVLLDTRTSALTPDQFDTAVSVAASIAVVAAQSGQRLRLTTPCGTDHDVQSVSDLLDELAQLEQSQQSANLLEFLPIGPDGGALAVLTGDAAGLTEVPKLRSSYRPIVCIDVTHDEPAVHTALGVHVVHADSAQNAVDAWNSVPA
ncbi:hypothetical protein GCM10009804_73810 [Kribbella hippodromi]|uniref:DUF58 domain-containing protein n=1 Tax=Kribbella hippodromi TaxID=434347 RepID=A0ABN2EI16_9ACTN